MRIRKIDYRIPNAPDGIEVGGSEWGVSKEKAIYTTGALTCVVSVIYLPVEKIGYIGHFSTLNDPSERYGRVVRTDEAAFQNMLEDIKSQKPRHLEVWLGGAAVGRYLDEAYEQRQIAEEAMAGLAPDELNVEWADVWESTEVLLNPVSGHLFVYREEEQEGPYV